MIVGCETHNKEREFFGLRAVLEVMWECVECRDIRLMSAQGR